jgi:hypothetical protein
VHQGEEHVVEHYARYSGVLADLHAARERLADADRRVLVSRKRCRLLRAAPALAANGM